MKPEELAKLETEGKENTKFPADKIPTAKYNIALDEAKRGEDGFWEVVRTVKQVVTFDDNLYFIREKAFKSIDKDFKKASETTHRAITNLLNEYDGDFWGRPEWDGMQYIMTSDDHKDVVEEEHLGIIEDVSDTKA